MPGWHEATLKLQQQGRLQLVGIVQEQHPERARLFMQWKGMDWPLMVDALDLLGVTHVPITVAIDEHGIVRGKGMRVSGAAEFAEEFVAAEYPAPAETPRPVAGVADISRLKSEAIRTGSADSWRRYAEALMLWGGPQRLDEAIQAYLSAIAVARDHGPTYFGLGTTLRARYDSPAGRPDDFARAVKAWSQALELDPNNYIWRRRIQQYGPRLDKPYPFYDWVHEARREIRARGEQPRELRVEPRGAEFAEPLQQFAGETGERREPDPDERVRQDPSRLVRIQTTVVPPRVSPGGAVRVHFVMRPNLSADAHWNNEAGDLTFWIDPPAGWAADQRQRAVPRPRERTSDETRTVEFELLAPADAKPGAATLSGYALYYVCEGIQGACLYRRQNVSVGIEVAAGP